MIYDTSRDLLAYIRSLMYRDSITIKDLSQIMDKPYSTTNNIFKSKNITYDSLKEVCNALGYELEISLISKQDMEKTG